MPPAGAKKDTPPAPSQATEAQLAKIRELAEAKGVEPPEPTDGDQAVEIIAALTGESEEPTEPTEQSEDDAEAEAAEEEEQAAQEAAARKGAERSDKETQRMFDTAVRDFSQALAAVFEVDELQPSQTPGVIGFVLPGYTEQKAHEDFTRCLTCNGFGTVLTGSMKVGDETRPCPDGRCKGRGYWERRHAPPPPPPAAAQMTGPLAYEQPPNPNGSEEWGEAPAWMGDPRLSAEPTP